VSQQVQPKTVFHTFQRGGNEIWQVLMYRKMSQSPSPWKNENTALSGKHGTKIAERVLVPQSTLKRSSIETRWDERTFGQLFA
jgi:hypothetical protein